jgi:hypothetical protein
MLKEDTNLTSMEVVSAPPGNLRVVKRQGETLCTIMAYASPRDPQ